MPDHHTAGRAVVTFSRSLYTLAAIRSLGRRGVEVIAGDEYRLTPGALSRHTRGTFVYPNSSSDPDGFLDALADAVRAYHPGEGVPYVLIPMHQEAVLVARHRERFEAHAQVPLPPAAILDRVQHKRRLAAIARERGIRIPPTWTPERPEDASRIAREVRYPAFVKVPLGTSGVGVERVQNAEELRRAMSELSPPGAVGDDLPLVQEAVPGDDYCVTALFDHGRPVASLTYRNVATFPRGGGPGAVRESVRAPGLEATAASLLGSLGWHGIAEVDFRWDGDPATEGALLEVNPRFFSGLFQAIESGVDYPWMLFELAARGRAPDPGKATLGTRTEVPLVGLLATVAEAAESEEAMRALEQAWREARDAHRQGSAWRHVLRPLAGGLLSSLDVEGRIARVRAVLEDNEDNVLELLHADDPMPVLGFLYPVAVLLRHGKITADLLTGGP